jgi:hypothetical protein
MNNNIKTKPYPRCESDCKFIIDNECKYHEQHIPTIAVDFDRVLFTHDSWKGHEHYGEPLPHSQLALTMLQRMGFKIMIWTTRAQTDVIKKACEENSIPYDYINENPNQPPEINPSKPVADYYIDDRAVRFTSWPDVYTEIKHREDNDPYYRDILHTKQCETCKFTELRKCMYHGYPKTEIPPSCKYKIGVYAEEAQENLNK